MKYKTEILVIVIGSALLALLIFAVVLAGEESASQYKAACEAAQGRPLFNGKFWECLK